MIEKARLTRDEFERGPTLEAINRKEVENLSKGYWFTFPDFMKIDNDWSGIG